MGILKTLLQFNRDRSSRAPAGITLLEVLAATFAASILVTALLAILIDLARNSRIEAARTESDREIKAALDYIREDLQDAIYVYTQEELTERNISSPDEPDGVLSAFTGQHVADADMGNPGNYIPVLLFWKAEEFPYTTAFDLPTSGDCSSLDEAERTDCNELRVEQRTFTLVAYFLDNGGTATSDVFGDSPRIRRYELRKYDSSAEVMGAYQLVREAGYVDPAKESSFANWPYRRGTNLQEVMPTINGNTAPVLVNFIDDPENDVPNLLACETNYSRVPATGNPDLNTSFFACVRQSEPGRNQDIVVYLRGNPFDRPEVAGLNVATGLPLAAGQTRVTTRSSANRFPN